MDQVLQFLSAVLPSQGVRLLASFFPGEGKPTHKDFDPLDVTSMRGFAQWADTNKGAEVYFAVGGYVPNAEGRLRRTAACAQWHRSLRLDLDVGASTPDKPKHATKEAAIRALGDFCRAARLPMPTLVDSGYGVHVYWPFDRDVTVTEWLVLAEGLRSACTMHGLITDTTVTTDAARILRMPGTTNRKHGFAVPVTLLRLGTPTDPAALAAVLPQGVVAPAMALGPVPTALRAEKSELQQNLHPPYFLRGVLTQCPGMAQMFRDKGATAAEPLWKSVLDLVNKSADPETTKERVAHHLSSGHAGYSPGGTQAKWVQTQQQNYEPPTCARMAAAGMRECASCPLRGSIVSPVVLGRVVAVMETEAPAVPIPPPPAAPTPALTPTVGSTKIVGVFMVTPGHNAVQLVDGQLTKDLAINQGRPCIRVPVKGDDGTMRDWWRPLCSYRLTAVERLLDRHGNQSLTVITVDRHSDGLHRLELSHGDLTKSDAFNAKLGAAGIHIPSKDSTTFRDQFMTEFLQQLQRLQSANQIAGHCGWTDDHSGFVLGTTLITPTSTEAVRPTADAKSEMEAYHAAGDEAAWRRAFDIALSGGSDRQVVLGLALAAPLMVYTGVDGLLLNAYSPESGVGKSTLGDAALSIWGSPNRLRKNFRDTSNAAFKLAAIDGNLPIVADEFTNVEGRHLSDYVYTITQGREKHRLSADAKLNASSAQWCLPTITTSNNSVHEKLQDWRPDAVAEAARVFELRLRPLSCSDDELQRNKLELQALRGNYGFLGPRVIRLIMQRDAATWRKVLSDRIAFWDRAMARDAGDRFRSACAALVELGAALGKALGFAFDVEAVRDVLKSQWSMHNTEFDAHRRGPEDMINTYLVAHSSDFAILGGTHGESLVSGLPRRLMGEIRGRAVNGTHRHDSVMIPMELLRAYCREQNFSFRQLQAWMDRELEKGGMVRRMGRLSFMHGTIQQVNTPAVEFTAAILGATALTAIASASQSKETQHG